MKIVNWFMAKSKEKRIALCVLLGIWLLALIDCPKAVLQFTVVIGVLALLIWVFVVLFLKDNDGDWRI
jgi:hypothetical protein